MEETATSRRFQNAKSAKHDWGLWKRLSRRQVFVLSAPLVSSFLVESGTCIFDRYGSVVSFSNTEIKETRSKARVLSRDFANLSIVVVVVRRFQRCRLHEIIVKVSHKDFLLVVLHCRVYISCNKSINNNAMERHLPFRFCKCWNEQPQRYVNSISNVSHGTVKPTH